MMVRLWLIKAKEGCDLASETPNTRGIEKYFYLDIIDVYPYNIIQMYTFCLSEEANVLVALVFT